VSLASTSSLKLNYMSLLPLVKLEMVCPLCTDWSGGGGGRRGGSPCWHLHLVFPEHCWIDSGGMLSWPWYNLWGNYLSHDRGCGWRSGG